MKIVIAPYRLSHNPARRTRTLCKETPVLSEMVPPHTEKRPPAVKHIEKSVKRHEIIVLTDLGWGYKRISKKTGVPVPTVQGIVQ